MSVQVQQCSTSGWVAVDQGTVEPYHQYWPVDLMAVGLMAVDLMSVDLMAVGLMAVDQHSVAHLPQSHREEGLLVQHECIVDSVIFVGNEIKWFMQPLLLVCVWAHRCHGC